MLSTNSEVKKSWVIAHFSLEMEAFFWKREQNFNKLHTEFKTIWIPHLKTSLKFNFHAKVAYFARTVINSLFKLDVSLTKALYCKKRKDEKASLKLE